MCSIGQKSLCILLVDDESLIRLLLGEELREAGFEVHEAEHGDHAAMLIDTNSHKIRLLVTDVHMPGSRNGIQVAAYLHERRPQIPVVFITGRPDVFDHDNQLNDRFILMPKPFSVSKLLAAVRKLLSLSESML